MDRKKIAKSPPPKRKGDMSPADAVEIEQRERVPEPGEGIEEDRDGVRRRDRSDHGAIEPEGDKR